MLDETWPVARVIHEIAGKLGKETRYWPFWTERVVHGRMPWPCP